MIDLSFSIDDALAKRVDQLFAKDELSVFIADILVSEVAAREHYRAANTTREALADPELAAEAQAFVASMEARIETKREAAAQDAEAAQLRIEQASAAKELKP